MASLIPPRQLAAEDAKEAKVFRAVTTDYRAVLSELLREHLGQPDVSRVFPGFTPGDPLGLLKS